MHGPFGSQPPALRCVRVPACARSPSAAKSLSMLLVVAFISSIFASFTGCAALRRRPVAAEVAAGRDMTQRGVTAMEGGDWNSAERLLGSAVESCGKDASTRGYFAETLWHRGATDAALKQMAEAVELDPNDTTLIVRYGEMLLGTGDTDLALARANQAIMLNPKLAPAWALRGRIYWRLDQTERALADLQRSLEYAPDTSDVLMDVAAIYRQRGQHERCLTTLQHLIDTYPPGQATQLAYWMEGLTLADLGRPQQAAESLRIANQVGPPNADILYYLAQAQLAAGRHAEAVIAAQEAVAANPTHAPSRQLLAQLATLPAAPPPLVR
ncbi:MAG: tetratricopeptide repeat protein [Pirellulales bacterium]